MKWIDFERHVKRKNIKLFTPLDVQRFLDRTKTAVRFLLYRLKKQGYVVSLRRGTYALPDSSIPDAYIANKLYEPSYVSLHYALSYHGIISETVYVITSITPKATRRFAIGDKTYIYRHVKQEAFTGYSALRQDGVSFLMADPEKAFVDMQYFCLFDGVNPISRFHKEKLNPEKTLRYASLFKNKKLVGILKTTLR